MASYFVVFAAKRCCVLMGNHNLSIPIDASVNKYILLDGLSYNTRGYFASRVVFFRAPQGRGKMRAMSKMSASIIC